jgi:hypothetical protein
MQLGQGFNSFLHKPCIDGAVEIPESSLRTQAVKAGGAGNVSQVVSYSSRFVEKISEVVRSMNISAASSIKSGTIEVSGNSLTVDEAKFAASDLNAVISVKVINRECQPNLTCCKSQADRDRNDNHVEKPKIVGIPNDSRELSH